MTRQKKEILRKIKSLESEIETEKTLSYGCIPARALDNLYNAIDDLEEELLHLGCLIHSPVCFGPTPSMEFPFI